MADINIHNVTGMTYSVHHPGPNTFYFTLHFEVESGHEIYDEEFTIFLSKGANIGQIADSLHNASESLMKMYKAGSSKTDFSNLHEQSIEEEEVPLPFNKDDEIPF